MGHFRPATFGKPLVKRKLMAMISFLYFRSNKNSINGADSNAGNLWK
jgi:hypothetical protein